MIKNERQYRITKAQAERFEKDLREMSGGNTSLHPLLAKAQLDALRSQLDDLMEDLSQYDTLRAGGPRVVSAVSFHELPRTLIQARIAAGWSQKDLAERLGFKEQQVQRYEATEYSAASLERIQEVAAILEVEVQADVFFPGGEASAAFLMKRFQDMGLDRSFVMQRLLPPDVAYRLDHNDRSASSVMQAANIVDRVFDVPPTVFLGTGAVDLNAAIAQTARFKVGSNANEKRLSAYTVYAHYVALLLLEVTSHIPTRAVPTDAKGVREEIIQSYGEFNLKNALSYMWDIGVPVLPLRDRGAFHGACWRVDGRNVIVLKQQTQSASRWLFDAIHEFGHAGQNPSLPEMSVVEENETSVERRTSAEEIEASQFAGNVLLDGRAEELVEMCVEEARGQMPRLKSAVLNVARRHSASVSALANYMAYRLSLQGYNWWGTAQNLQEIDEDPWSAARDILLERVDFGRLNPVDRGILQKALEEEVTVG